MGPPLLRARSRSYRGPGTGPENFPGPVAFTGRLSLPVSFSPPKIQLVSKSIHVLVHPASVRATLLPLRPALGSPTARLLGPSCPSERGLTPSLPLCGPSHRACSQSPRSPATPTTPSSQHIAPRHRHVPQAGRKARGAQLLVPAPHRQPVSASMPPGKAPFPLPPPRSGVLRWP